MTTPASNLAQVPAREPEQVPAHTRAKYLSTALEQLRLDKGSITWDQLADACKVSTAQLRNLRTKGTIPRTETAGRIEVYAGWEAGSIRNIMAGGKPTLRASKHASEPQPPAGKGFRWSMRPNGTIDYYLTAQLPGGQEVTLHAADLDNRGRDAIHEDLLKAKENLEGSM